MRTPLPIALAILTACGSTVVDLGPRPAAAEPDEQCLECSCECPEVLVSEPQWITGLPCDVQVGEPLADAVWWAALDVVGLDVAVGEILGGARGWVAAPGEQRSAPLVVEGGQLLVRCGEEALGAGSWTAAVWLPSK